jgi:glyoxylate utilization-related uncharacterized protein
VLLIHREGTGQAEIHEHAADFVYVISGEAAVVVSGTMVEGKTTGREKSAASPSMAEKAEKPPLET